MLHRLRRLAPRNWPIVGKVWLALVIASLIPFILIIIIAGSRSRDALRDAALQNLQLQAQAIAQRVDQFITDTSRIPLQLARNEAIQQLCAAESTVSKSTQSGAHSELIEFTQSSPDFALAYVTDADGKVLISTDPDDIGQSYTFREYWQTARAGMSHVSDLLVGRTTGRPGIFFTAPIRGTDDHVVGVCVLKISAEAIWRMFDEISPGERGYAALSDNDGLILAFPDRQYIFYSLAPLSPEDIARINPMERLGRPTINQLDLTELDATLKAAAAPGNVAFDDPVLNERWISGYAPMQTQPWVASVVQPLGEFTAPIDRLQRKQYFTIAIVLALTAALAALLALNVVRPVRDLTRAAEKVAAGDFSARAHPCADDELGKLAQTFNRMVPQLEDNLRMRSALALAMEVQQHLLPRGAPAIPGLDIAGRSVPCDETGGDYFDFLALERHPTGEVAITVGDVTGHGISAALLMTTGRALIRSQSVTRQPITEILARVNQSLEADTPSGRFMTLFYLVVDPQSRSATWASAGHDPALMYRAPTNEFDELAGEDVPLGVISDWTFHELRRDDLQVGDTILIGTDGIWELRNPDGIMFGKQALREVLRANAGRPAEHIVQAVLDALTEYRSTSPQTDDITLIVIRIVPHSDSLSTENT